tara:strand:- start:95 stop:589 length:495 start_codon:yes stop_codon:yes gene_type:complete
MTTFRKIPVESEIAGDEPLSDYALGYLTERVRNNFYDYVLRRFHEAANEENLTKAQLAKRLGLGPDRISKILGAPGNWTLDTIAELLVGICREELVPNSKPYLTRVPGNFQMEDFLSSLPSSATARQSEKAKSLMPKGGARRAVEQKSDGQRVSQRSSIKELSQ